MTKAAGNDTRPCNKTPAAGSGTARFVFDLCNMDDEVEIRHRAHLLWLAEGKPEGKAEEHWQRAQRELACINLGRSAARLALTIVFLPAYATLAVLRAFTNR